MDEPPESTSGDVTSAKPQSDSLPTPSLGFAPERLCVLRERLMSVTYRCPKEGYVSNCPFRIIAGLSHESRRALFEGLDETRVLKLLDLAQPCVCPIDPRTCSGPL